MAEQQRIALATRPLIEALADKSRAAFTINSSAAALRSNNLLRKWEHSFTNRNPKRKFAAWAFQYMFRNRPEFSVDDRWLPVRPLGAGSFGAVGLFEHQDDEGQVDDYVVAKYAEVHEEDSIKKNILGISREAAIMMQLNEIPNSEGVLFLRNFRHYADTQVWLHLLEYCPSLNLEALRLTYKAMRRTLPEAFLWHTFYALAKGLVTMEQGPFGEDLEPSRRRAGAYLIHRDIKPENTFMGYSPKEKDLDKVLSDPATYMGTILDYPHAKIADFGLSRITTNGDPKNTAAQQQKIGSAYWRPPEMRVYHMPKEVESNQFPKTCFNAAGNTLPQSAIQYINQHAYTPAGNTFVVGYMMYQMMTMDEPDTMHDYLNQILAQQEDSPVGSILDTDSIQLRNDFFENFGSQSAAVARMDQRDCYDRQAILTMLENWQDADYSAPLKDLVQQCMNFQPSDRPAATALLQTIEQCVMQYLANNTHLPNFEADSQVYTREEDLSSMQPGDATFDRDGDFWAQLFRTYKWLDASAGCIRPDLGDSDVPEEAVVFFTPGMREKRNKRLLRLEEDAYDEDEGADIRILNPSKRRKGYCGEVLRVRDDETPTTDIRLDDTPTYP